jgi:8-oxo-dGTP pyrophosphatase MutT (NUDIX family)
MREAKEEVGVTVAPEAVEFSHHAQLIKWWPCRLLLHVAAVEGTPENREPEALR